MSRGRILVTGGAGYIGSHACKTLARAGYIPITYDNLSNGHRWAVRWGPLVEGDLADTDRLRRTLAQERIDAVMHFAAFAYVGESMAKPREYFQNNVVNTLNLLGAMQDTGVGRIVVSSTCSVYGEAQALPIPESQPCLPINPYGESKLFVERALAWHEQAYGLRWMALRYFNAAGADPEGELGEIHEPETHVLPLVIQTALGLRPHFDIFGTDYPSPDGSCVRDFVHVSDVADAHVRALDHLVAGRSSLALNLGTGTGHSVRQVIAAVERLGGRRVVTRIGPRRPGDAAELVAAPGRAGDVLGWHPAHSDLDAIVSTAWSWHAQGAKKVANF